MHDTKDFWFQLYTPREGDTIVDVGAGVGEDLKAFSKAVGPSGRVIAIEAHPSYHWRMHFLRQEERLTNVSFLNYAVSDHVGTVFIEDNDYILNRVADERQDGRWLPIWGETLDLIHQYERLGVVDFMKMNIEGGERKALLAGRAFLDSCRYVCIACHDFRGGEEFSTSEFVVNLLESCGFDLMIRRDDPREYVANHVHGKNRKYL